MVAMKTAAMMETTSMMMAMTMIMVMMMMMMIAMLMMKNDDADVNAYDDIDGDHILHCCPAGARHPVEQLPKRETIVACGRRVGAHLSSPMADELERVREGRRGLERKGLVHVFIVTKGQLAITPSLGRTYGL